MKEEASMSKPIVKKLVEDKPTTTRKTRPALTIQARENQLINAAIDLAEKQILDGTASSQVITHYLKLGSTKEKLEQELMQKQNELLAAKTENLHSGKNIEKLYKDALEAMTSYGGHKPNNSNEEEDR